MHTLYARILTLTLCLILSGTVCITAQRLMWSAEVVPYFDNREYSYERMTSGTQFAVRLTPTIGFEWKNHSIAAGLSWIQPIDSRIELSRLKPTLYYRYNTQAFSMSMGMFPRTQLIEPLDDFMRSDSLSFYSPNIQGALFQHRSKLGYVEALVDWRGLPTETTREAFMIVAQGRIYITPWLCAGGAAALNHLARAKNEPAGHETHVTDNVMIRPYIGADLSHHMVLDSLMIRCGYLATLDRERGVTDWIISHAFVVDITAEWRFLGIRNKFYIGVPAQQLYNKMGATLYQGETYYGTPWHNRLDIYGYIFRNSFVNCFASINFHFTPGEIGCQQQIVVRAYIDQDFKKKLQTKEKITNIFY